MSRLAETWVGNRNNEYLLPLVSKLPSGMPPRMPLSVNRRVASTFVGMGCRDKTYMAFPNSAAGRERPKLRVGRTATDSALGSIRRAGDAIDCHARPVADAPVLSILFSGVVMRSNAGEIILLCCCPYFSFWVSRYSLIERYHFVMERNAPLEQDQLLQANLPPLYEEHYHRQYSKTLTLGLGKRILQAVDGKHVNRTCF